MHTDESSILSDVGKDAQDKILLFCCLWRF